MRHLKGLLMTAGLTLAAGSAMAAQPQEAAAPVIQGKFFRAQAGRAVQGEYIVVLKEKPNAALPPVARQGAELARLHGVEILNTYEHAMRGFHIRATEAQALALAEHPLVASVEENAAVMLSAPLPANPQTGAPWNLDRIDQGTRAYNNTYAYEQTAEGTHVYVVDTGVSGQSDEFALDEFNFESRVDSAFIAWDEMGVGSADSSPQSHGTFVAAIIGSHTYGVAKRVRLHSVKVANDTGFIDTAHLNEGLNWLVANAQTPAVVNLSVNTFPSISIDTAAAALADKPGIVLVSAAGNTLPQPGSGSVGTDACNISPNNTPAKKIIVVAATDKNDRRMFPDPNALTEAGRALYSNYGPCVDLFAPGVDVPSLLSDGSAGYANSGTSFAAPHVTGLAAILLSQGVPASSIKQRLIDDSLKNLVTDPGTGSPNRLLYKKPPSTPLSNGVAVAVSGAANSIKNYVLAVPPSTTSRTLVFTISGGTGDADMYVRAGDLPETHVYNCRPLRAGNNETCTFSLGASSQTVNWFVQLRGFTAYSTTLKGQY
ncbi:MAG TPA: S8 family peptidase [Archangium sp.]|uniref:S8 family peptidase n=1 Tax=Archangium sp. TaxID=1872627 RepID=UPI002E312C87|nr:S8 family peptidase [Archangium sp.]HEX5744736.1 S8 family peptidase [Archangium sp.]